MRERGGESEREKKKEKEIDEVCVRDEEERRGRSIEEKHSETGGQYY